jgi:hypothetical protein
MKTRTGFVSNSSSASFVVLKYNLSPRQIDHIIAANAKAGRDAWDIEIDETEVTLRTNMDNFDMHHLLRQVGVAEEHIVYGDW